MSKMTKKKMGSSFSVEIKLIPGNFYHRKASAFTLPILPYALRPLPHALCPMPTPLALCPMPFAKIYLLNFMILAHVVGCSFGNQFTSIKHNDTISMGKDNLHVMLGEQYADVSGSDNTGSQLH